jgi:hypothetical protein
MFVGFVFNARWIVLVLRKGAIGLMIVLVMRKWAIGLYDL